MREGKREIKLRTRFDSDLHLTRLKKIKESSEASQLTGEKDTFGGGIEVGLPNLITWPLTPLY